MKELPWRKIGARLKLWTDLARKEWEGLNPKVLPDQPYGGSRFSEVWNTIKSDPYGGLPIYGVTTKRFFCWF